MSALSWARTLVGRLRRLAIRDRAVDDVTEELHAHLELLTERYRSHGMDPREAALAAHRQLGNVTRVREDVYTMNGVAWIECAASDLAYACRQLTKARAYALAAVVTTALGIGATTAVFSVTYAVLLKPLPYTQADRIFSAEIVVPERREHIPSLPASVQAFLAWRTNQPAFSDMAALRPWECNLTGDGEPEQVGGARVSANFFSFLGVPVARGRGFVGDEETPGQDRVVVISDALWRQRYGADPAVVGRSLAINGENHEIVGVAAPEMLVPTGTLLHSLVAFASRVDIWRPIAPTVQELRGESWDHGVLVRLAATADLEAGRQQLEVTLNDLLKKQLPGMRVQALVQFIPIREVFAGKVRPRLLMLLGAAALLLLTACASLANLLLARVATRAHEFATRLALGAGRVRIVCLTLAETALVTLLGAAGGVALAVQGVRGLMAYGPAELQHLATARVNAPMLGFAIVASAITALVCGIYPAWRASRHAPSARLQDWTRTSIGSRGAGRSQRVLVGVEMALATALLASAGLLLHSFVKVIQTDRGYQIEQVLTADLSLFGQRYDTAESRTVFYRQLIDAVRGLPGVVATGGITDLPAVAASTGASRTILLPTDPIFQQVALERPVAMIRGVTSGYLAASGTPILSGRFLNDEEPEPVAVISAALARRLWPGEPPSSAVGRQIRQSNTNAPLVTVAGVVRDARPGALDREPPPVVYRPYRQWASGGMTLVVRTREDSAAVAPALRSVIRRMDPNLPILAMRTMREVVSATVSERQFQTSVTSLFALLALLLGAVGLYGVVSYTVAGGTRDLALRIALGAGRRAVFAWVFAEGMRPVLVGFLVGLVSAMAAARAMRSLLFEVAPTDPVALGVVSLILLLAAALACYFPARRAARVDPAVVLRAS